MNSKFKLSIEDYNNLIDNHPDAMVISDLEGKILAINDKLAKIFGKSKEDLIGTYGYDNVEGEAAKRRREVVKKVIKTKKSMEVIDQERGRWWRAKFKPIFNKEGDVVKLAYYIQDITDLKEYEINIKKKEHELDDASLKFQTITENIDVGLYYTDANGKFLWANKRAEEIAGISRKEVIGKTGEYLFDKKSISKKDYLKALKLLTIIKLGKKAGPEIFNITQRNGNKKIIEIQAQKIKLHDESLIIGIVNDITDRLNEEKKRIESEMKFRDLADNSPNMIFINKMGKIAYVNKQCIEIMGYNEKEFLSKDFNFMNLIAPESKKNIEEAFKKHSIGIDIPPYEYKIITKKQKKIDVIINTKLINYENSKAILGIITEISDMKDAEKEIKKTKDYLQNVIDNTSEIILTIDSNHKIKTWNKKAEQIIGYKKKQIISKDILKLDLFEYSSEINNFMNTILNKKPTPIKEIKIKTAFGTELFLNISPSFIEDEKGKITEIILICRDITKERQIQEKLNYGNCYIIDDIDNNNSIEIFLNLLENEKGIFVGRQINDKILKNQKLKNYKIFKLSLNKDDATNINNLKELEKNIENILESQHRIILIDRIDFFISTFSFNDVLKSIYRINDLIKKYNSILILRINSNLLKENEVLLIKEEFESIPYEKISDIILNDDLVEIIKYINNENSLNINVTYGSIGKMFNISKVTVKKRIETLIKKDLIISRKIGKVKLLFLTEKGKNLMKN